MPEMLTIKGMHVGEVVIQPDIGRGLPQADKYLTFCRQMGVEYINSYLPLRPSERELSLEEEGSVYADRLARFRGHVESFGLKLASVFLPIVSGSPAEGWPSILTGTPERDREIERVCQYIKAAGKAGIPIMEWCTAPVVLRNPGWTSGRGGIRYVHFDYDKMEDAPPYPAGPISAEQAWERIEYFLKRVIPVAEEYKVKMACHPNDVPIPPGKAYRGIAFVRNNIDGLKRFIDLYPSPYHGLSFCQGCVSEFSTNPEQVYEAIRYFGSRKKIFWVHFRNLRGGFLKFEEVFPDEGDIDMAKAMRIYKEVGYDGVLVPDHVPGSDLDTPWRHRAHAFCIGYIKALIQAVESES